MFRAIELEGLDEVVYEVSFGELKLFSGVWSSPIVSGVRPPPCAAFSLTKVDDNHAVLFGGMSTGQENSDVYILDLSRMVRARETMHSHSKGYTAGIKRALGGHMYPMVWR